MRISAVKAGYALVVVCGLIYAFIALRGPAGIPGLIQKRRVVQQYERVNLELQREIQAKQDRIQRLQDNPSEQEMEIRQRLKLARPGEKIYIIDGKRN